MALLLGRRFRYLYAAVFAILVLAVHVAVEMTGPMGREAVNSADTSSIAEALDRGTVEDHETARRAAAGNQLLVVKKREVAVELVNENRVAGNEFVLERHAGNVYMVEKHSSANELDHVALKSLVRSSQQQQQQQWPSLAVSSFARLDEERERAIATRVMSRATVAEDESVAAAAAAADDVASAAAAAQATSTSERMVEVRVQALRRTFGIIDHYYLVIEGMEYHPGYYKRGNFLPLGTTANYHVVARRRVCLDCYNKIIADFNLREDKRIGSFYPFLNCESLATGFSLQSLGFLAVPFVAGFLLLGRFLLAVVTFLLALLYLLLVGKYTISRTVRARCRHLPPQSANIVAAAAAAAPAV